MKRICFIHRKTADTPSIERVFGILADEMERQDLSVVQARLPYSNNALGILANLLLFRPPPADIYHITGHVHYIALRLQPEETVLTVHDLGILRNRTGVRRGIIKKLFFDWPFRRLRYITAISEATKLEMIEKTDCEPAKITVINDPLDPKMQNVGNEFRMGKPVILLIGTAEHKNVKRVVDALAGLDCKLIIVGIVSGELTNLLKSSGVDFENPQAENDEQLYAVFKRSDLVVFCSTFEGFGLPIIEAQAMGIPLITSDLAPMNQIAGDGAVLVDPYDVSQIRNAIQRVISDPELRLKLVTNGRGNVKQFDPQKIAGEYVELYRQIEAEKQL
jgi:glycosyltransferase involved in cell wall biosynthesis